MSDPMIQFLCSLALFLLFWSENRRAARLNKEVKFWTKLNDEQADLIEMQNNTALDQNTLIHTLIDKLKYARAGVWHIRNHPMWGVEDVCDDILAKTEVKRPEPRPPEPEKELQ